MKYKDFLAWLSNAKAGDRIVYHVGNIGRDRTVQIFPNDETVELNAIADIAWKAAAPKYFILGGKEDSEDFSGLGVCDLTQRNLGHVAYTDACTFEYVLSVRRSLYPAEIETLAATGLHRYRIGKNTMKRTIAKAEEKAANYAAA